MVRGTYNFHVSFDTGWIDNVRLLFDHMNTLILVLLFFLLVISAVVKGHAIGILIKLVVQWVLKAS